MILRFQFLVPFSREFFLNLGACRVSPGSCQDFLNGSAGQGNTVVIVTGGEKRFCTIGKNWLSNRWIWGQSIVGYLSLRRPVTTIVARSIHVNQITDPTQTDIDQLHCPYVQTVEQLYETNKANYGFEHVKLEII
ncbi:unnamed protein product [Adineta ricciae]|uniref:Uncharacterized protein n=1 Tax=Adineta ricciae TaxID=249248 RepID=A0A814MA05_ADIRI|nr:unnamed protein product [Adineta ricciae]CAF1377823.1 unnamed protein product [Adineta ricciae]